MVSPVSKGLFQAAILQSGAPYMHYEYQTSRTERLSRQLIRDVCVGDVTDTSRLIECLQNVPSSHVLVSHSGSRLIPIYEDVDSFYLCRKCLLSCSGE